MWNLDAALAQPFGSIPELIRAHAQTTPTHPAVVQGEVTLGYAELDQALDRVAASLQRDGLAPGDVVAVCAQASAAYVLLFLGAVRAGVVVAPLAPSATPAMLDAMVANAQASRVFRDGDVAAQWPAAGFEAAQRIALDDAPDAGQPWSRWLVPEGTQPAPITPQPDWPFNLIYSSGTTGVPKGIVQPWGMRWSHVARARANGYGPEAVSLVATPLYSNTTLVAVLPTLALGGTLVLMAKFDAAEYLRLAEGHRATHTMLVPVQYQRLMDAPSFDAADLSAFRHKFCTSAPFRAALKREVLDRWPGELTEYYGMTEGGGTLQLDCHAHPGKLHTVGQPLMGTVIKLIDEQGREVAPGELGEVVGRSGGMMTGYHRQPDKTREAEWFDDEGERYIRTGDVGRWDEDGFLVLGDRKKDMIITGGFTVYPSDIEAELAQHPSVRESAVVGGASRAWGETPVAYVVLQPGAVALTADALREWLNARVAKTQRLADLRLVASLPRSEIGKVLKRELRDAYGDRLA